MAAILKNWYDVITAIVWLRQNLAGWLKITCRWLHIPLGQNRNEIEFQYGGHHFPKIWSSFISAVDWDILSKFGMQIDFHHFELMQLLNLISEVDFWVLTLLWPPSWNIDTTSEVRWCSFDYCEISQVDARWHAYNCTYTVGQNRNWK